MIYSSRLSQFSSQLDPFSGRCSNQLTAMLLLHIWSRVGRVVERRPTEIYSIEELTLQDDRIDTLNKAFIQLQNVAQCSDWIAVQSVSCFSLFLRTARAQIII